MTNSSPNLNTSLVFYVMDMQGMHGFPQGREGLVFEYRETRTIQCRYTGCGIKRDARYVLRTDGTGRGWRIDLLPKLGPAEAVYGVTDRATYWPTPEEAAQALVAVLDEIRDHTSLAA